MRKRVIEEIEKSNTNLFVKFRLNLPIKYTNFDQGLLSCLNYMIIMSWHPLNKVYLQLLASTSTADQVEAKLLSIEAFCTERSRICSF